jgi:hypothetical protein
MLLCGHDAEARVRIIEPAVHVEHAVCSGDTADAEARCRHACAVTLVQHKVRQKHRFKRVRFCAHHRNWRVLAELYRRSKKQPLALRSLGSASTARCLLQCAVLPVILSVLSMSPRAPERKSAIW